MTREEAATHNDQMLFADGFDEAILGVCHHVGKEAIAAYDYWKCVQILVKDGASEEEAEEYMAYNVLYAYHGSGTPCFIAIER